MPASASNFPLDPVGPLFTGIGPSGVLVIPAGIGTHGRDTVRTPGELDLDLRIDRQFSIDENLTFVLRAAVTSNAAGQAVFNSPAFGLITSERAARCIQLSGRLVF